MISECRPRSHCQPSLCCWYSSWDGMELEVVGRNEVYPGIPGWSEMSSSLFKNTRRFFGRHSLESSQALANYNNINHRFKNYFIHPQIQYEESLTDKLKDNPKSFHQYIRGTKVGAPSVGPLKCSDGSLTEQCDTMAEMFVTDFASVFKMGIPRPSPHQVYHGALDAVHITLFDVSARLGKLDSSSCMGPNGLHPWLLKSCPALAYPIFLYFWLV
ncbi:hypothetical protein Pcinc_023590 [Petrolisthes cinctipes]|uniref:Uncharacterized protein n=1 Tax=Petrolisthes cinctipes TaxID=88211 RepID=A0AAE1FD78_PETCI|nr:hypothetical protein Pcinc_023590 [Petrolisthes cinctipes]